MTKAQTIGWTIAIVGIIMNWAVLSVLDPKTNGVFFGLLLFVPGFASAVLGLYLVRREGREFLK